MKMLDDQKHSEEKLQEEREKAERLAKRMEESMQTEEQLRQELSDVMISRANDKIVSVELENEIEVVNQREAEASKVTKEVEYEIFYPYYEWKNIKKNQKAFREDQCEFRGEEDSAENPRQVRIQINWSLTLTLEGGNDGAKCIGNNTGTKRNYR